MSICREFKNIFVSPVGILKNIWLTQAILLILLFIKELVDLPSRSIETTVLSHTEEYIWYSDVVLIGLFAIKKVSVRYPYLVKEFVIQLQFCDVTKVECQSFVVPNLSIVELHGIWLKKQTLKYMS